MRKKTIYYNFTWVGYLLMVMGSIFGLLSVLAIPFGSIIEQDGGFQFVFLLSFGLPGLILISVGLGILLHHSRRKRSAQYLMDTGNLIICDNLNVTYSNIRINYEHKLYLTCSYVDNNGETYIFKSPILRYDPTPYLNDQVNVYHDPYDIKKYYIDIDGSLGNVHEL